MEVTKPSEWGSSRDDKFQTMVHKSIVCILHILLVKHTFIKFYYRKLCPADMQEEGEDIRIAVAEQVNLSLIF